MALALAVAVTPVLAAEHGGRAAPRMEEERRTEPPAPPATFPAREVLQTLERLRLHPGHDALDVTETARKRPEKPADSTRRTAARAPPRPEKVGTSPRHPGGGGATPSGGWRRL